ncbi:MAG: O-antigen ligase family protein [Thermoleophilia bacterium]|nr:O-antigen ligase family protein [Thermoleophilia bacterium]
MSALAHRAALSRTVGALGAVLLLDAALGLGFGGHRTAALAVGLAPAVVCVLVALARFRLGVLAFAALAIDAVYPVPVDWSLPFPGGVNVFLPDILAVLALVAWLGRRTLGGRDAERGSLRTAVLGWPLLLFAALVLVAVLRGHERYGAGLLSIPLRLFAYAGIGGALTWLRPREAYRGIVAVFYLGAVWQGAVAVYLLATGGSEASTEPISTGGYRVLAGSTALFLSGSLLLALLNVRREPLARRQAVHLLVLAISLFGLVLTFQRTTFAAIGVLVPVLFVCLRQLALRVLAYLPLCAPFVLIAALLIPAAAPQVARTLERRLTASPRADASVLWREKAMSDVWEQVRESPLVGVGFGRDSTVALGGTRIVLHQDPHNQFVYLLAGGGALLLASFAALLLAYVRDATRRLRYATGDGRVLVLWSLAMVFVYLVNTATGIVLTSETLLLALWVLLLLPAVVRPEPEEAVAAERVAQAPLPAVGHAA